MKYKIGTREKPLQLKTPPLTSDYTMHVEEKDGKEILVCTVGKTVLHYDMRCINDLYTMLKNTMIGWNSEAPMSRNPRRKER